jgi:hypothetical protein
VYGAGSTDLTITAMWERVQQPRCPHRKPHLNWMVGKKRRELKHRTMLVAIGEIRV